MLGCVMRMWCIRCHCQHKSVSLASAVWCHCQHMTFGQNSSGVRGYPSSAQARMRRGLGCGAFSFGRPDCRSLPDCLSRIIRSCQPSSGILSCFADDLHWIPHYRQILLETDGININTNENDSVETKNDSVDRYYRATRIRIATTSTH